MEFLAWHQAAMPLPGSLGLCSLCSLFFVIWSYPSLLGLVRQEEGEAVAHNDYTCWLWLHFLRIPLLLKLRLQVIGC